MSGIPGVYIHSLLGSRNYTQGVQKTDQARTINREKLLFKDVAAELADPSSLRHAVFHGYQHLLACRIRQCAFHPNGNQQVLQLNDSVFSLLRTSPDEKENILALHNVSNQTQFIIMDPTAWGISGGDSVIDILNENSHPVHSGEHFYLDPYQIAWLKFTQT